MVGDLPNADVLDVYPQHGGEGQIPERRADDDAVSPPELPGQLEDGRVEGLHVPQGVAVVGAELVEGLQRHALEVHHLDVLRRMRLFVALQKSLAQGMAPGTVPPVADAAVHEQ